MPACPGCGVQLSGAPRFCPDCGTRLAAAEVETRKTVTVLFCDVVGSTATGERLDPETLRHLMQRYFTAVREAIELHGGTVEKFVGDAAMAVFGIPAAHEDDALRGVRAAAEVRRRLRALNHELERHHGVRIRQRTGVNTGEVVVGAGETLATGDAVNVGARLEQRAAPDEILIGEETYRLVRHAVDAEPVEPLELHGKAERVRAWRLITVHAEADGVARHLDAAMVGREEELARLLGEYARAKEERTCRLCTLVGDPGIGKSRLAREMLARVGTEPTVMFGRCLPYGEGITYWPLIEMTRGLDLEALLAGLPRADVIAERLRAAMGAVGAAGTADETAWAVRKLLERLAADRPVIAIVDDIQWAEAALLDLLEHIAFMTREAPILLLVLARKEFLDARTAWPGERLALAPLDADASLRLVDQTIAARVDAAVRERISATAAGNPLFVEQMVAMLADADGSDIPLPPTIHALLAARLDRLADQERRTIEYASVVGQEFWSGAVREISGNGLAIGRALVELVRHDLIEPAESIFPDDDGFAFRHLLIRDAAYASVPKERRARAHECLARWFDAKDAELGLMHDEIVGYHLEQAYRYRTELGQVDAEARRLAAAAYDRLGSAGRRAWARGDGNAAVNLFERARRLVDDQDARGVALEVSIGNVLFDLGRLDDAAAALAVAVQRASAVRDRDLGLAARQSLGIVQLQMNTDFDLEVLERDARAAVDAGLDAGGGIGLVRAAHTLVVVDVNRARFADMYESAARLVEWAEAIDDRVSADLGRRWMVSAWTFGPCPAAEAAEACAQLVAHHLVGGPAAFSNVLVGLLRAMAGDLEGGRRLMEEMMDVERELGLAFDLAVAALSRGMLERYAGDLETAVRVLQEGCAALEEMHETGYLSTVSGMLGVALAEAERIDEAERAALRSRDNAAPQDVVAQSLWRQGLALVEAARANLAEGERLAREAAAILAPTDALEFQAEVLVTLAGILTKSARRDEAADALRQALDRFERKGHVPGTARARALLDQLEARPLPLA